MAETDIVAKSTTVQPNQPVALVEQKIEPGAEERIIKIKVIGGVAAGDYESSDYKTAKRAWELFVEAGIEPQNLIAGGLAHGEKYSATELKTRQLLKKSSHPGLIGESRATDEALLAYRLIGDAGQEQALIRLDGGLVKVPEGQEVIEATVILPDKQPKIAESLPNILPEDA